MKKDIKVYVEDIGEIMVPENSKLEDVLKIAKGADYKRYYGARVDNQVLHLNKDLKEGMNIRFIDIEDVDGHRIYTKTISAVFIMACKDLFPERTVKIEHFLGAGLYTEFEDEHTICFKEVQAIQRKMEEIISKDHLITRRKVSREEAIEIFQDHGYHDKVRLFKTLERHNTDIYSINGHVDTYHGYLAPSTGYVNLFKLKYYYPGVIILFPTTKSNYQIPEFKEQKKLAKVFKEANDWAEILDLGYLGSLNEKIMHGEIAEVIRVSEALHEKKIGKIADMICQDDDINMILIAGPSSSGKTTFAERLAIQLKVNGKRPVAISVDNYFVNRDKTPLNEDGSYNFEIIDAIDLDKLNEDLVKLLEGGEIELPKFNFLTGVRENSGKKIKVDKDHPIIVEGIHGLNPQLTREIPEKNKFKIYISALTQLNIDSHNRIPTTDTRLIRRIIRDNNHRGNDPIRTFELWSGVRKGEEKYIFPFQEEADVMFDSALVYELSVLKKHIKPLLEKIDNDSIYYSEAKKMLKFLKYFRDIEDESIIPPNSILREFIGGTYFDIH